MLVELFMGQGIIITVTALSGEVLRPILYYYHTNNALHFILCEFDLH